MLTTPLTPVYTPQSRVGTQFTPGIGTQFTSGGSGETVEKESIPFQDLSKLAKRMDWAVVKMTNVPPFLFPF